MVSTSRIGLQVGGGVSALTVADNAGKARAQVAFQQGIPMVTLMDEAGTMRAAMMVAKNSGNHEVSAFSLFDGESGVVWQAP